MSDAAVLDTAAPASSTPSSDGASSAPQSRDFSSESPRNFREALDRWESTASDPLTPRAAADPESSASRPTGPDPAVTDDVTRVSAAPVDPQILSAERAKWEAELGPWAELRNTVDPNDFRESMEQLRAIASDPIGFYESFGQQLHQAGMLSAPQTDAPPLARFELPAADLQTEDGATAYSAERVGQMMHALQAQIDAKIQPLTQESEARQIEAIQAKQMNEARSIVDTARKEWEGFGELEGHVKALMAKDKRYSLEGAYLKVYRESYRPTIRERERASLLEELKRKGEATTARPAGSVSRGGTAAPVKTFKDAILQHGGAAAADRVFG